MRTAIAALSMLAALALAGPVGANHIGTRFTADTNGCSVTFRATTSESSEDGAWIAIPSELIDRSMDLDAMVRRAVRAGATHGTYDIRRGERLAFGPYRLSAGDYILMWDQEPLGSWEKSHDELPFSLRCSQPTPRPTPRPTPEPTPTQSIVPPATATPPPGGSGEEFPNITPPPTDTKDQVGEVPGAPWYVIALLFGLVVVVTWALTPRRQR